MLINVVEPATGRSFTVDVSAEDTIATVKALIWDLARIPVEIQELIVDGYDTHDDDKLFEDWRLKPNSKIYLVVIWAIFIKVDSRRLLVGAESYYPVELLKAQLHALTGIEPHKQRLYTNHSGLLDQDHLKLADFEIKPGDLLVLYY